MFIFYVHWLLLPASSLTGREAQRLVTASLILAERTWIWTTSFGGFINVQVLPRYLLSMPSFIFAGVESSRGQGRGILVLMRV